MPGDNLEAGVGSVLYVTCSGEGWGGCSNNIIVGDLTLSIDWIPVTISGCLVVESSSERLIDSNSNGFIKEKRAD